MSRNFRLINTDLDPDSVFFLGDLFDGGREWPPEGARLKNVNGREYMEQQGILAPAEKKQKRSWDSYRSALTKPHANPITKADHNIARDGTDLKAFFPGEDGKFMKWGSKQWYKDLARFAKIFYDPAQVYPIAQRRMLAAYDVQSDPISVANGADAGTKREYATSGKSRKIVSSLPGNHDVGFGAGVQLMVRDRFESHFGSSNRVDVVGNHTVISVDSPSLSARSQYLSSGWESGEAQFSSLGHIWQPTWDFIENVNQTAEKAVRDAMREYYPLEGRDKGWKHEVMDASDPEQLAALKASVQERKRSPQLPVLLLSHVPLFRNPDTECGAMRERGHALKIQFGYQYQNVLTQALSKDLVSKVSTAGEIAMIFSGDDHDYCDVTHRYNIAIPGTKSYFPNDDSLKAKYQRIREITVKSFSWAMGVRRPGFLLVSLWNPIDSQGKTIGTPLPTVQTHNCLLPDQLTIFIDYGLLFIITIPILLAHAIFRVFTTTDIDSFSDTTSSFSAKFSLPRFQTNLNGSPSPNGLTAFHKKSASNQSRHARGSSMSTSSHSVSNSDAHLSVQRSTNARARSVSPAKGYNGYGLSPSPSTLPNTGPLIDRAGYFPQVKWIDPTDEDSDEESNVGSEAMYNGEKEDDDSQAKWKWRQRTPGKVRMAVTEFGWNLLVVGAPGAVWYFWLVKHG